MTSKFISIAAAAAAALSLAACATATPDQPRLPGQAQQGGYSDARIEANRFRVDFAGNSLTSRDTVETYLLYRAAELTVNQGYDWFAMAERKTDKKVNTYVNNYGPYGYGWAPSWRYYGRFGWRTWDPFWGDPFWANNIDVQTVEKYDASAEIVMYRGPKPGDNPRAFDARDVMANLGSKIVRPPVAGQAGR